VALGKNGWITLTPSDGDRDPLMCQEILGACFDADKILKLGLLFGQSTAWHQRRSEFA